MILIDFKEMRADKRNLCKLLRAKNRKGVIETRGRLLLLFLSKRQIFYKKLSIS